MVEPISGPRWPGGILLLDLDQLGAVSPAEVAAIERRGQPSVATVTSACTGAALAVAVACDLLIASPTAAFGRPDAWTDVVLRRAVGVVGRKVAAYLALSGRLVDAHTALQWRLVNEVTDDPPARAQELAGLLAGRSPVAVETVLRQAHVGAAADHARSTVMSWPWNRPEAPSP